MKFSLLSSIEHPSDIKKFNFSQLNQLAQEIREYIIEVVKKRGGHIAPSLGAVELAIALHYVFDSPRDKIIWDVGHQAYAHKILTDRRDLFTTLRSFGGISGFIKRGESPHDQLSVGHASTSLAAALGFATARDLMGENYEIVAVIGDGALTGGLAWEALNQIGAQKRKMIIVLNDNGMSIAKNVGSISHYFSKLRHSSLYLRSKRGVVMGIRKIPFLYSILHRINDALKSLSIPPVGTVFEELGFTYVGIVNGHDLKELIHTLQGVKRWYKPVIVHVATQKGKGLEEAEKDPEKFHGIDSETKRGITYSEVFANTLIELAKHDKKIIAITAAMPAGTKLSLFQKAFPDRFFDVGIAEELAVTFAVGLALQGFKPFVAIYSTFLQRAFDQLIHDVALHKAPVRLMVDRAGIVGEDGPTHHGAFDLSFLRLIPNMIVASASNGLELKKLVVTAYKYENGPFAVRYPRGEAHPPIDGKVTPVKIGTSHVIKSGKEISIIATGRGVTIAKKAIEEANIDAELINAIFIKPIDRIQIIKSAKKTGKILVVEENTWKGGLTDAVLEVLNAEGMYVPVEKVTLPDAFVSHGKVEELHKAIGFSHEAVIRKCQKLVKKE